MARANKHDTQVRAVLETVAARVAVIRNTMPVQILRVKQARERSRLFDLLSPAVDELDLMSREVDAIGADIMSALEGLVD